MELLPVEIIQINEKKARSHAVNNKLAILDFWKVMGDTASIL